MPANTPLERVRDAVCAWRKAWSQARGPIMGLEPSDQALLDALARSAGVYDGFELLSSGESHDKRMADDVIAAMTSAAQRQIARTTR